jgi:SPP1 gp7 family putative phage head morphogenesis protein
MQMQESELVKKWEWLVTNDDKTCEDCLANSGKIFELDEPFDSHPNCRCTLIPRLR